MAKIYIPATGECELLDDIDFMAEARTIRFSLDGIHYEVDLSPANLQNLRECLQPFIRFSHIVRRENHHHETTDIRFRGLISAASYGSRGGDHEAGQAHR